MRTAFSTTVKGDENIIRLRNQFDEERNLIGIWYQQKDGISELINALLSNVRAFPYSRSGSMSPVMQTIYNDLSGRARQLHQLLNEAKDLMSGDGDWPFEKSLEDWLTADSYSEAEYAELKSLLNVSEVQRKHLVDLEERLHSIERSISNSALIINELAHVETKYTNLRDAWRKLHEAKITLLGTECERFSLLSKGQIKVEMDNSIDTISIAKSIKNFLEKMGVRTARINSITETIAAAPKPVEVWYDIMNELEIFAKIALVKMEWGYYPQLLI